MPVGIESAGSQKKKNTRFPSGAGNCWKEYIIIKKENIAYSPNFIFCHGVIVAAADAVTVPTVLVENGWNNSILISFVYFHF